MLNLAPRHLPPPVVVAALAAWPGVVSCQSTDDGAFGLKGPVDRGSELVLEFGATYFEVTPADGARITGLRIASTDLLSNKDVDPINYGSTFWPSPQNDWNASHWPPPAAIDRLAYANASAGAVITLSSDVDPETHLRIVKTFSARVPDEAVELAYTITNQGDSAASWAPWEITRVAATGLTFWPTGGAPSKGAQALLPSQDVAGHTWIDGAALATMEAKLFADGAGGWLAHVSDGLIFIKQFPDITANQVAPGEAEIEVYVDPTHRYMELEPQGPYTSIAAGGSATWTVRWYARQLPPTLIPSVGNQDLVRFVNETLR
jgi:hypothetical protein